MSMMVPHILTEGLETLNVTSSLQYYILCINATPPLYKARFGKYGLEIATGAQEFSRTRAFVV